MIKGRKDTIQHTCGFPEPTARQHGTLAEMVTESTNQFFAKRGLPIPEASRYYLPVDEEIQENPEPVVEVL